MRAIGVNTLEGWFQPQFDEVTLDEAHRQGIRVIMPFELNHDYDYSDPAVKAMFREQVRQKRGGNSGGGPELLALRVLRHGESDGLSSNRILSLLEDREGSLWVGTADGGLDRIKEQRIAVYTAAAFDELEGLILKPARETRARLRAPR